MACILCSTLVFTGLRVCLLSLAPLGDIPEGTGGGGHGQGGGSSPLSGRSLQPSRFPQLPPPPPSAKGIWAQLPPLQTVVPPPTASNALLGAGRRRRRRRGGGGCWFQTCAYTRDTNRHTCSAFMATPPPPPPTRTPLLEWAVCVPNHWGKVFLVGEGGTVPLLAGAASAT